MSGEPAVTAARLLGTLGAVLPIYGYVSAGRPHPDVAAECAADPDPLTRLPEIGQHLWLEGRYVIDTNHFNWAELHPLYRWGAMP
jgi:hypothetical protein